MHPKRHARKATRIFMACSLRINALTLGKFMIVQVPVKQQRGTRLRVQPYYYPSFYISFIHKFGQCVEDIRMFIFRKLELSWHHTKHPGRVICTVTSNRRMMCRGNRRNVSINHDNIDNNLWVVEITILSNKCGKILLTLSATYLNHKGTNCKYQRLYWELFQQKW